MPKMLGNQIGRLADEDVTRLNQAIMVFLGLA
jgi:mRNA-degrading endonuclease toxin of MazEF toxin-antitoxin module